MSTYYDEIPSHEYDAYQEFLIEEELNNAFIAYDSEDEEMEVEIMGDPHDELPCDDLPPPPPSSRARC